jgi:signal transduction histidine kinase
VTNRGALLIRRLAADFTARWWAVFVLVIVLPSLGLSVVSLRLIDRLAKDEVANLIRASEAVPWYYEEKMNRALEARALHAARIVGYETLQDPQTTRTRLADAHLDLFESLTIDRTGTTTQKDVLMASARGAALPLDDEQGRALGTLRYNYSKEGLRTVLKQSLNDRRAPWNDDAVEFFIGGPVEGRFRQDFDLHLIVRALDPVLWERQGRTQDLRFASARTSDGFAIEVAIPWRHIGVKPQPGASLRFDLTNDDDDDGGPRKGQRNWSGHDRNWVDPSRFGVLRLVGEPGSGGSSAGASRSSIKEAEVLPAVHPITIDGRIDEPDWKLTNDAPEVEGQTDNVVRWGALWTRDELLVAVHVVDANLINDQSHEDVDWVLRIVDPDGEVLLDSSPEAERVLSQSGGIDLRQMISLGALRGSQILFAFRDRPITKRILRWKISAAALIVGMDLLLGFGLWLVYTNVKRQMDLAALKSHFVATVSHEFKAPLALLQASAETLRGGRVQEPEKRKRYEAIIESESRRLAALVDNVLSVSRIEAGRQYQFKHTEVPAVVDAALSLHKLRLEQQGFEVEVAVARDLPAVTADAAALQEALSNLLDNAIKYSREVKRCRIEAKATGEGIEISVADSGLGVPVADKDKIFERFYRGEREGHGEKGVGLGLSIARDILRAHGGDVRVENVPGGGSIFTLVLPGRERAA